MANAKRNGKQNEVHWPEGNCLLSREEMDFASREPDYNAIVKVEKAIGTVAT